MFEVDTRIFRVHGVDRVYQEEIRAYLHEKLEEWCKNHEKENDFAVREWLGGPNRDWRGTPLQELYNYYSQKNRGDVYAYREAGKAAGRILKSVIGRDERIFRIMRGFRTIRYRWV